MIASGTWRAKKHKAMAAEARAARKALKRQIGGQLWLRHVKVDADRMRIMLRTNFGVKEQDLRHLNKRKLAACLAEQLLYETDDEDDGDGRWRR